VSVKQIASKFGPVVKAKKTKQETDGLVSDQTSTTSNESKPEFIVHAKKLKHVDETEKNVYSSHLESQRRKDKQQALATGNVALRKTAQPRMSKEQAADFATAPQEPETLLNSSAVVVAANDRGDDDDDEDIDHARMPALTQSPSSTNTFSTVHGHENKGSGDDIDIDDTDDRMSALDVDAYEQFEDVNLAVTVHMDEQPPPKDEDEEDACQVDGQLQEEKEDETQVDDEETEESDMKQHVDDVQTVQQWCTKIDIDIDTDTEQMQHKIKLSSPAPTSAPTSLTPVEDVKKQGDSDSDSDSESTVHAAMIELVVSKLQRDQDIYSQANEAMRINIECAGSGCDNDDDDDVDVDDDEEDDDGDAKKRLLYDDFTDIEDDWILADDRNNNCFKVLLQTIQAIWMSNCAVSKEEQHNYTDVLHVDLDDSHNNHTMNVDQISLSFVAHAFCLQGVCCLFGFAFIVYCFVFVFSHF